MGPMLWMLRNQLAILTISIVGVTINIMSLRLEAKGKIDAEFVISSFALYMCTFSEILMSTNSSNAIFPYLYISCMNGILLDRIFKDSELIHE